MNDPPSLSPKLSVAGTSSAAVRVEACTFTATAELVSPAPCVQENAFTSVHVQSSTLAEHSPQSHDSTCFMQINCPATTHMRQPALAPFVGLLSADSRAWRNRGGDKCECRRALAHPLNDLGKDLLIAWLLCVVVAERCDCKYVMCDEWESVWGGAVRLCERLGMCVCALSKLITMHVTEKRRLVQKKYHCEYVPKLG